MTSYSDGQGTSWTDTETQLERLKMENRRLTGEVASLRRFYSRNTSLGYSCQAEQLRVRPAVWTAMMMIVLALFILVMMILAVLMMVMIHVVLIVMVVMPAVLIVRLYHLY